MAQSSNVLALAVAPPRFGDTPIDAADGRGRGFRAYTDAIPFPRGTHMKRLLVLSAALLFSPAVRADAPEVAPKEGKSERIGLFNGKDIDDWEGHKELWSVKDGVIVG